MCGALARLRRVLLVPPRCRGSLANPARAVGRTGPIVLQQGAPHGARSSCCLRRAQNLRSSLRILREWPECCWLTSRIPAVISTRPSTAIAGQLRDDRRTVTARRIGAARRRRGARWSYLSMDGWCGLGWSSTLAPFPPQLAAGHRPVHIRRCLNSPDVAVVSGKSFAAHPGARRQRHGQPGTRRR